VKVAEPGREYVGFEPNPNCLRYAERLVQLNGFSRSTVVPIGLSDHAGLETMFLNPDVDPSATLVKGFRERERYHRTMIVPVAIGDEAIATVTGSDVAVVKIDVEGGELEVLRGLQRTLRDSQPIVICEVLPVFDATADVGRLRLRRQSELRDLLQAHGYRIFRMHLDESISDIDDFGIHADLALTNYLFVPMRDVDAFLTRFRTVSA
jgi:FkbM family methyltransferase